MEELAKIGEIIASLGESGKSAFIWWIVLDTVQSVVWATVVGCALWALFRRLGQAVANAVKAN